MSALGAKRKGPIANPAELGRKTQTGRWVPGFGSNRLSLGQATSIEAVDPIADLVRRVAEA
jgi:hypothetical protein